LGPNRQSTCSKYRPEEYESGSTGGERCDGEEGEEVGVGRWGPSRQSICSKYRPEEYESGSTGGDGCDGEGGEEVGEEEGGAQVDLIQT
jgi:hypothetical protein